MMQACPQCGAVVPQRPGARCPHCGAVQPLASPSAVDQVLDQLEADPARSHSTWSRPDARSTGPGDYWIPPEEPGPPVPPGHDPAVLAFYRRVFELTPRVPITKAIVLANLAVFVLMAVTTGEVFSPRGLTLVNWGSNFGPRTLGGEWWRLATCTFVHVGLVHVAINMWVFWELGQLVERLVGHAGFVVLYLISGIGGSLASVYWRPEVNSAGASGAVFGVFGALMGFLLFRSDSIPKRILSEFRSSGGSFLLYNLAFGFLVQGIDMAAHLGGLGAGFICGLVLSQRLDRATPWSRLVRNFATAVLGIAGILIAIALAPPVPIDLRAELKSFRAAHKAAIQAELQAVRQRQNGNLTDEGLANVLEEQVLPPWRELLARCEALRKLPPAEQQTIDQWARYIRVREEAWGLWLQALRSGDLDETELAVAKLREADEAFRELNSAPK